MNPQDQRHVTHLLMNLWSDLFIRFDDEPDVDTMLAGDLATAGERAIRDKLKEYYS